MNKYFAFDTETGGLDPTKSPILTLYAAVLNEDLMVEHDIDLKILPESPFSIIEPGAIEANKINMEEHLRDPDSVTRTEASHLLLNFIKAHSSNKKGKKLKPFGQNVDFDIKMVQSQLVGYAEWEEWLHYQKVDTMHICGFLKDCGWLPSEVGKLESLVKYFELKNLGAHNAKNDTLMTIDVYRKFLELMTNNKKGGLSLDILEALEK